MKKILIILVAAVIVLALSLAYAETMTKSGELFNGVTYFELGSSCEGIAGAAAGGLGGPISEATIPNGVTSFETVRYMKGMGSCVNIVAEAAPAPAIPHNGVTYFEMK